MKVSSTPGQVSAKKSACVSKKGKNLQLLLKSSCMRLNEMTVLPGHLEQETWFA